MESEGPEWDYAHVQNDVNPHILSLHEGNFSLGAAEMLQRNTIISFYISFAYLNLHKETCQVTVLIPVSIINQLAGD